MSLFQVKSNVLLPLLQSLGRPQPLLTETVGGKKLILSSDDADNRLQYRDTICPIIGLLSIMEYWNSITITSLSPSKLRIPVPRWYTLAKPNR